MSVFITVEGAVGVGKSTHVHLLREHLAGAGIVHLLTREPGGTPLAEQIRELLLDPAYGAMSVVTKALLMAAGRADHCRHTIFPALQAGHVVICDQFVDFSLVHQGAAGGLPIEYLTAMNEMATGALKPHRTILLDLPLEAARARWSASAQHGNDPQRDWWYEQVREGYLDLARAEPRRIKVVDASGSIAAVQQEVRRLVDEVLPVRRRLEHT